MSIRPSFLVVSLLAVACSSPSTGWLNASVGDAAVTDDTPPDVAAVPDVPASPDAPPSPDLPPDTSPPDAPLPLDAPPPDAPSPPDAPLDAPPPPDAPTPLDVALPDLPTLPEVSLPDVSPPDAPRPDVVMPPRCGDRTCTAPTETCASCPMDCGPCDRCAMASSCGTCTPVDGCGWCRTSNRCMTGSQTGSSDRSCSGSSWAWTPMDCAPADPCARYTSCRTCAEQSNCGWCSSSSGSRCATGNDRGPSSGSCFRWYWRASTCG